MANKQFVRQILKTNNPNTVITEGFLRSDVLLTSSNANITFPFLLAQSQATAKCYPLNPADGFCVTAMSLKIYKSADTAAPSTATNIAKTIDYSYPNPSVFSKSGEAANLESLYNALMKVTINNNVIFSQYPVFKFRRVNTSQQGTQSATTFQATQSEEQNGLANGLVPLEPTINMLGNWTMVFQLIPPAALDLTGTTSTNYISLILDGFLLQQGALSDKSFAGL